MIVPLRTPEIPPLETKLVPPDQACPGIGLVTANRFTPFPTPFTASFVGAIQFEDETFLCASSGRANDVVNLFRFADHS